MKLGVFLVLFGNENFERALDRAKELGLDTVEIGTGNYPGNAHCNPEKLLKNDSALKKLKGAVYHVHAKDTKIDIYNTAINGVLDTKTYLDEINRSWIFRTVGYGHGREFWNDFVSTLRMTGYDGTLSIEHEDSLMSIEEGIEKAVAFLKDILMRQAKPKAWWA